MLHEPDVTLTDFALAIECAWFVFVLLRQKTASLLRKWFVLFFASLGLASLSGGIFHGFLSGVQSLPASFLWVMTLGSIGLAACAAWGIGAELTGSSKVKRLVITAGVLQWIIYFLIVLLGVRAFWFAILNYLPAAVFLFIVFWVRYIKTRDDQFFLGGTGLALVFLGSFFQQRHLSFSALSLTPNALYHVIEGIAFFVIFLGARKSIA